MAETSDVKIALDEIAGIIKKAHTVIDTAESRLQAAYDQLNDIPTTYSDEIATINGYTPTGAFETLAQDEKTKLQTEFNDLKTTINNLLSNF